jgi:CO/xanthine dehydrogenase Mo-binding subunit
MSVKCCRSKTVLDTTPDVPYKETEGGRAVHLQNQDRRLLVEPISVPVHRFDAAEKTGGLARYIADLHFDGMLVARTLRSTSPRARIRNLAAPALPEGYAIVDHRDIPGHNQVHLIEDDWPFFAVDEVNHIGEPILLVVGPDRSEVQRLVSEIDVDYEELEPVGSIEESLASRNSPIYGERNTMVEYTVEQGDPNSAFEKAGSIFEDEYKTGLQEHAYLEPQGVVAVHEGERMTVYGSMQCPFYMKTALEHALGWDGSRIRIVQTVTGGGFGGKEDYPSLIAGHAAFAALKTGRPVQLVLDRAEDLCCTTKRHPAFINYRTAVDEKGRITATEIRILLDGGAYVGLSSVVLQRAMFMATGVYGIPHVRIHGEVLATNNAPTGAFRGFGAPQALFAVEMHLQSIAERLGQDPLDFKMRHALKKGDRTVTGGRMHDEVKLPEMAEVLTRMSSYRRKQTVTRKGPDEPRRGIGISLFFHGCAFTGSGERDKIKAVVKLRRDESGRVELLVSSTDMGQGPKTTLRKIVSRTLGIPVEHVRYDNPDTDRVPDSGPTVASRTIIIVGYLLEQAAREMKERWAEQGELEVVRQYRQPEHIRWDQELFQGDAYPTYSWGANAVEVEIDPVTMEVAVTGAWGVFDIGTPIDEKIVEGQIRGGMSQGLGYATIEVLESERGKLLQANLTDYIIPTTMDYPTLEVRLVESRYELGPYGAKCVGELPFLGAAPALAAAVQHALGKPITRIPVTPEYLMGVNVR